MKSRYLLLSVALFSPVTVFSQSASGPTARFETNLGNIDVQLLSQAAPLTVANFLNYLNRGAYSNSIIHRSVPGFIVQGGGFTFAGGSPQPIPSDPAVQNEFGTSNIRGTLAMAKLDGNPNSATNQWFFNLADNSRNLNNQNGGFTVFGRIRADDDASFAVLDKIAAVPVPNPPPFQSPFDQMPLIDYRGGQLNEANLVIVKSITILDQLPAPVISGVVSASSFGAASAATAGSYIELYGTNLAGTTRSWDTPDFAGDRAPRSLDGVIVTVNGQAGYVYFVSPNQVNVQVPALVPANRVVPVVLLYRGQRSEAVDLSLKPHSAGVLAPPSFKVNEKQYVAAAHSSNGALIGNGAIPNVPNAPAAPGETIVFYGTGFGPVTPVSFPISGQIARGATSVTTPVQFHIADQQAQILYAGHVPGLVGLYQFNVTIPSGVPAGDQPVRITVGGEAVPQTLFLPIRAN